MIRKGGKVNLVHAAQSERWIDFPLAYSSCAWTRHGCEKGRFSCGEHVSPPGPGRVHWRALLGRAEAGMFFLKGELMCYVCIGYEPATPPQEVYTERRHQSGKHYIQETFSLTFLVTV